MYTRNNVLKLVALVLIHYDRTLEEIYVIVHKVCWQYAWFFLTNNMKTQDNMRIFQVSITNAHLNAKEVSLPVIEYNVSLV